MSKDGRLCSIQLHKQQCKNEGNFFFKFPDDNPELKKTWIDNLRLENFVYKKSKRLCEQRFKNECFEKDHDLLKELGLKFKSCC